MFAKIIGCDFFHRNRSFHFTQAWQCPVTQG
nr:MAG TPA: hypothetical protein [Caudoviricetes sp.]